MTKFKNYDQFNEGLDINSLFKSLHGAVKREDLKPLKPGMAHVTQEDIDFAVKFLEIDPSDLYYDPSSPIQPVVYWKGPFFYPFFGGLDPKALEMMHVDKYFERKKKQYAEYLGKKDYIGLFSHVDKKAVMPVYMEMYKEIPDDQKYETFIDLYVRSEFGFDMLPKKFLEDVFSKRHLSPEWKKSMEKFKKLTKGKEEITVYRGVGSQSTENGMSWTLSKKTAKFFADRFSQKGKILTKTIKASDVLDYLDNRGESEVLIFPEKA